MVTKAQMVLRSVGSSKADWKGTIFVSVTQPRFSHSKNLYPLFNRRFVSVIQRRFPQTKVSYKM